MTGEDPFTTSRAPRRSRIALAQIDSQTLGGEPSGLRQSFRPGTRKEHYHREWMLGRIRDDGEGYLLGRLGYERTVRTRRWDDGRQDFVREQREDFVISPFAVDLATRRVAFQTRGQQITASSFIGALQAILNEASALARWRVRHIVAADSFDEWLKRISRLDRVRVRVERPNPNYRGRDRVRELVEGLNAKAAELRAQADPDDPQGLDTSDALLREFVEHANRYGSYAASGTSSDGTRVDWASDHHVEEREAEVDPETGEVPQAHLREILEEEAEEDRADPSGG